MEYATQREWPEGRMLIATCAVAIAFSVGESELKNEN
jgi:hypothetical protein